MIKITNDGVTKVVTHGAYESLYKPLGYKIVEPKQNMTFKKEVKSNESAQNNELDKKDNNAKKEVNRIRKTDEEK